jgi:hypothetical protein
VDSIDHILAALYDVISGPAHQPRDWNRMRSLFVPGARLIPVRIVPGTPELKTNPATDVVFLSIDDYIARASGRMEAEGFFERGLHNEVAQFSNIVSVFSTYESRHGAADAKPFARGINSIQLLKDGGRYWIVDVFWDAERPEMMIPPRYLPQSNDTGSGPGAGFRGEWTGQLEYRDYSTDERVFLPTWLTMEPGAGGGVRLKYVYDDGPAKVVREELLLTLDAAGKTATVSSGASAADVYSVSGFEHCGTLGCGTLGCGTLGCGMLTLTGKGMENDKPVDVKIEVTLGRNLFTWVKSTRATGTGDAFRFRDGYRMTRAAPPA